MLKQTDLVFKIFVEVLFLFLKKFFLTDVHQLQKAFVQTMENTSFTKFCTNLNYIIKKHIHIIPVDLITQITFCQAYKL